MASNSTGVARSLDEERIEFQARRFLAMPLAGTIAWSFIALAGATLSPTLAVWALFILSGSIIYLGLTGLMWAPLSWMIQHWIGLFHATTRTLTVLVLWYALPDLRFVAIPLAIVCVYLITMVILENRWRRVGGESTAPRPS